MAYRQDLDTGEWIEVDAAGNPLAAAPSVAPMVVGKPKPPETKEPKTTYRAMTPAEIAASGLPVGTVAQVSSQGDIKVLSKAEAGPAVLSPEDRREVAAEARQKIALIDSLIDRSKNGWFATGFGAGTASMIPGTTARDVAQDVQTVGASGALQRIMEMARNNGGKNPLTPLSNADFQALGQSIANLDPSQSDEQFQRNLQVYRDIYERALGATQDVAAGTPDQQAENELDKVAAVPENSPPDLPPANEPGGNAPTTPASGGGIKDIARPDIASMVRSMIAAGAGFASVNAALKAKGARTLSFTEFNQAKQGRAIEAHETRPLTMLERAAGSPLGALAANYADAATAGTASAIAGDSGEGALAAMQALHPSWSGTGSILGSITGAAGAEAALLARAPAALARFAPRVADGGYGALTGFNASDDGEGGEGAMTGAVTSVLGGFLGDRALRAAGAATRGVTNPAAQYLRDRGVPLTVGQTVEGSGLVGRTVKGFEDRLGGLPLLGDIVNARRAEGLQAFNRAAFQDAAAPGAQITATGAEGIRQVRQSVQDAYGRALDPVDLDVAGDPQLLADITNAQFGAASIPQGVGQNAIEALDYRIGGGLSPSGRMDGRDFQESYRGLGRDRRTAADPYAHEFGQAMREGQEALADALERQQPGQFPQFLEANAANRRGEVLAQALNPNALDELITPAQLNRADFNSTSKLESKINAASGNRPFYDLASAGQSLLPSRVPDSGTAGRVAAGVALGGIGGSAIGAPAGAEGAATGGATGLSAGLLLALGGTRFGQRAITEALLNRPAWLRNAGDLIAENAQIGGWTGAGVLTPLLVSPQ